MKRLVLLDSSPLGLACKSPALRQVAECLEWLEHLQLLGVEIGVPEIARYEIRRELIRINATKGLQRLEDLEVASLFLPIKRGTLDRAAELWAHVRRAGRPTAPDQALDGDAILAAQALVAAEVGYDVVVATSNVAHLNRFPGVDARLWSAISG